MAFAAIGPFTDPDPLKDESYPNAYFIIHKVEINKGSAPHAGKDSLASYRVFKTQAAFNNGKRPKFENTVPFDYSAAAGNIFTQALTALKAQPEYPGLIDA
jgi:hypothetical protein